MYGQLCFVLKDPVTLRYFRLQPVEHFLARQFDGRRTARDLHGMLQQQFADSGLTVSDVLRFVGMLHEAHLLTGQGPAHAQWLATSGRKARRGRALDLFRNFLFFKMPLFNPDKLLNALDALLGPVVFSRWMGVAAILVVLAGLGQVLAHADRLANLPYSLLSVQNLAILYAVFIGTKVFHEFGHGMAAKRFGAEVSQMGVMLFVFTPSFYCDTSDAWMIPSRRARLWINSGGVVVELVIAGLAALVWANTPADVLVNQVALNIMISCSVATLIFNANPLLRYDGYYFLADLLEIPNLMTKGREFIKYYVKKYVFGTSPVMPPDRARLGVLIVYAMASSVYRWLVFFGIVGLLYYFFDQYGLGPIGVLLVVAYVALTIAWPFVVAVKFLLKQRWNFSRRLAYVSGACAAGVALLGGAACLPWNMTIRQPMVVVSQRDEPITVQSPGTIEAIEAEAGDRVAAGQVVLRLRDPALENQFARATARRDEAMIDVDNARAANQPGAVAAATTAVDAFDKQLAIIRQRMDELVVRSPIDGVLIRDTPLRRLMGNYVQSGARLARVIDTGHLRAEVSLPQQQAALVSAGMGVRMRLWADSGTVMESPVTRVSSRVSDQLLHPALGSMSKGEVEVSPDAKGQMKSAGRRSTVVIDLPANAEPFLADGMTGRAEITVSRTTVGGRIWRLLLDSTTADWRL